MPEEVGHYYLLHRDIARRFNRNARWVLDAIRDGKFGTEVIEDSGDFLVPLHAYNSFVRARQVFDDETGSLKPIFARTPGEAKQKLTTRRKRGS